MKIKFAFVAAGFYAVFFVYVILKFNNIFNAAWYLAITSIPASLVADIFSRTIVGIFGDDSKNIYIDLILLLVLGAFQYGLIGFVIGWLVDKFRTCFN